MWDTELRRWIPNPHYLRFDPDLSCYWRQHLRMHGKGPESVLEGDARYSLVGELLIVRLRGQGFPVRHSPNGDTSIGCAHSSVDWPPGTIAANGTEPSKKDQKLLKHELAREFSWIYGDMPAVGPEGG
jgi:hypothetical protein